MTPPPATPASGPPGRPTPRVRDRALRYVGIPMLGLLMPRLFGLLDPLTPRDPLYWAGTAWFLLLCLSLWTGNRRNLSRLRERYDWRDRPVQRLLALAGANAGFTTFVAGAFTVAWALVDAQPGLNWRGIAIFVAGNVLASLLVTHLYETLLLIQGRLDDRIDLERNERARLEAELSNLKSQLAPHLMFNSLNTLGVMIREDPAAAREFNQRLAEICRYLLSQLDHDLVPLGDEVKFFDSYLDFVRLRFPGSLRVSRRGFEAADGAQVPPASLQVLLENVLKHNAHGEAAPLDITLEFSGDEIRFGNTRRPHAAPPDSTGVGLRNLHERCLRTVGRPLIVEPGEEEFVVRVPVRRAADGVSERAS